MAQKHASPPRVLPIGALITGITCLGIVTMFMNFFSGLVLLGVAITMFGYGLRVIPAQPFTVGLITVKGIRGKVIKKGVVILAPYWPFLQDVVPVQATTINQDFSVKLFCKATDENTIDGSVPTTGFRVGVEVTTPASLTFRPDITDGTELQKYLNNGGETGVKTILDDILPQLLKQKGTEFTFEELTAARKELMDSLAELLTGAKITQMSDQEKVRFHQEMKSNGRPDGLNLGIIITKINVGSPIPGEEVRKAAESQSREEFERRGEVYEVETEIRQARALKKAYGEAGENKSLHDCILEIRRRKSVREGHGQVIDIPGIESIGEGIGFGIAALIATASGQKNTQPQSPTPRPEEPFQQRRRQHQDGRK